MFYIVLYVYVLSQVSLERRGQCRTAESGKLRGGREKEGTLLPLFPFFLSHTLVYEAQEAGRKVHIGVHIKAGRNSLCQMRSPAGHGYRGGQGTHRT